MNRFFVPNDIYEDRIAICKECPHYFKTTGNCLKCGCFVKVKSRIAVMSCPIKKWNKTTKVETPDDLPQEIINEILKVWKDLQTGRAKDHAAKKIMIELYNTIYSTNYSVGTSCSSCLSTCFNGIKTLYKKYSK